MKSLSTVDIHYLVDELQYLLNAKVDKIYMPEKKELLLQLHLPGKGKKILRIVAGKLFYVGDFKPAAQDPSGFCMYLRKHVFGRLRSLNQLEAERIIELVFENKNGTISLIVELFGKGNIMLVKDGIILNTVERQNFKDRAIKQKEPYVYPHQSHNFITITKKELADLLSQSTKESLVKAVALDLSIGGVFAEQVCQGMIKEVLPKNADVDAVFKALTTLRTSKKHINETLNALNTMQQQEEIHVQATATETKEHRKIQKIIDTQSELLLHTEQERKLNTQKGEAIYTHYQVIQELLAEVKRQMKTHSLQELKKKLQKHPLLKDIDPKNKTMTIEV